MSLSILVPIVLILPMAYVAYSIVFPAVSPGYDGLDSVPNSHNEGYTWIPLEAQRALLLRTYTPKELAPFDGTQSDGRILLAIDRKVFDVTAGRTFYGPDGPYGNFAGRDASRGMAKQSFELEMLTPIDQPIDKLQDLTPSEIENMNGSYRSYGPD
ncbi:Putative steroid membrane receptor Hpr6.6/25-Dx [Phaffia rhodozyma]|uniref:Putative steroid membrane receptor Hpr6.6/25-Dx n=1 Tax=Phaffia rhodozyma TaxID=264483 RepID=A0A0F7SRH7_PHARH|nr:Putative steroid membrane receptor Hpr6.6/25-Dx [Phaffia rhodozyma]